MAGKNVTVRLDPAEHSMLRSLHGKTDSEKLRNLIRSVGATDGLAVKIAGAVAKELALKIAQAVAADGGLTRKETKAHFENLVRQLNVFSTSKPSR